MRRRSRLARSCHCVQRTHQRPRHRVASPTTAICVRRRAALDATARSYGYTDDEIAASFHPTHDAIRLSIRRLSRAAFCAACSSAVTGSPTPGSKRSHSYRQARASCASTESIPARRLTLSPAAVAGSRGSTAADPPAGTRAAQAATGSTRRPSPSRATPSTSTRAAGSNWRSSQPQTQRDRRLQALARSQTPGSLQLRRATTASSTSMSRRARPCRSATSTTARPCP